MKRWIFAGAVVLVLLLIALAILRPFDSAQEPADSRPSSTTTAALTVPESATTASRITQPEMYTVTMLDTQWLYEPPKNHYAAGERVLVRINYTEDFGFMLFCNGVEVTNFQNENGKFWQFVLTMPAENITLDLKIYDINNLDFRHELLIKAYFRQFPDTETVYLKHYYGDFASGAEVAIFNTISVGCICSEAVAGYQFRYPSANTILVRKGSFYSMQEAFDLGYLTQEDIEAIYLQHIENYAYLYTDDQI